MSYPDMICKLALSLIFTVSATMICMAQVNITFQVDMTDQSVSANGVHLAGSLNGWSPSATTMTDTDGDGIYTVTLSLNSGEFHEFKYINDNDWPGQEVPCEMCSNNTNRYLYVPFEDVSLPTVKFTECATEGVANVTFQVDMSGQSISANGVHIAGYVNGWNPGSLALTNSSGSIYSVTKQYRTGEYLEYKFINDNDWPGAESPGSDCQISTNRFIKVPDEDIELEAVPFGGCSGTSITFQVDLGGATIAAEGVKITGNFNNWNPSNVSMSNTSGSIYSKTFVFPFETEIEYKYVNGDNFGVAETPGVPCSASTNRQLTIGAVDQVLDAVDFGGCDFDYLVYQDDAWSNLSGPGASDHVSIEGSFNGAGFECDALYVSGELTTSSESALVVNGDLSNDGTIEIPSGSSLVTLGDISGDGEFIIHKNTRFDKTTGRYSIVGSPVTNGNSSELGSLVYEYDESVAYGGNEGANRFLVVGADASLTPGKGYFSAFTGAISFEGTPNTGEITVPIPYTAGDSPGFNLVANPYPAAIAATDFIAGNDDITGTLYLWDDNDSETARGSNSDYLTINEFGMAGNMTPAGNEGNWDGYIRSGQGFFVQADASAGSVVFNNAMKSTANNTDGGFFRENRYQQLRIILTNDHAASDILIGFSDEATSGEDKGLDARKFSAGSKISLYSLIDDRPYVIEALSAAVDHGTFSIGFEVDESGTYQLILDNDLYPEYASVQLYDATEDLVIDLVPGGNEYIFTTSAGVFNDRFSILANKNAVITNVHDHVKSYPFTATFYSLRGEVVRTVLFEHANQQHLLQGLENQLLLMRSSETTKVQKVLITQ